MNTSFIMKLVGERIRQRRLTLGLSIDDLAKKSASSIDLIKQLEWSMLKDIELTTLLSIAAAMGQSLGELLHDIDRSEAPDLST